MFPILFFQDRPSRVIYQPGMGKFSKQRFSKEKETPAKSVNDSEKKIPEINVDHRKFGQHSTKLTLGWQQFKACFADKVEEEI